jgi:hypothetical protein
MEVRKRFFGDGAQNSEELDRMNKPINPKW